MRQTVCLLLIVCLLLAGCGKPAEMDKTQIPWVVPSELLGQPIKDALKKDWDNWNNKDFHQKVVSSHLPGAGYQAFDSWAECEAFVGLTVPNPLETCDFVEKGTYAGMPVGFADAPRMEVSWFGTEDGHLCMVTLSAGYYCGDVRMQFFAKVYGDPPEGKDRHPTDAMRTDYLEHTGGTGAYIVEDAYGCNGTLAKGHVLYHVNVIGSGEQMDAARAMLDRILALLETVEVQS